MGDKQSFCQAEGISFCSSNLSFMAFPVLIACLVFFWNRKTLTWGLLQELCGLEGCPFQRCCTHMHICACLLGWCFLISHIQTGSHLSFTQCKSNPTAALQGSDPARPSRITQVLLFPAHLHCSCSPMTSHNPTPASKDPSCDGIIREEKKEPDSPGPAPVAEFPSCLTSRECRLTSGLVFHPLFGVNLSRAVPAGGGSLTPAAGRRLSNDRSALHTCP